MSPRGLCWLLIASLTSISDLGVSLTVTVFSILLELGQMDFLLAEVPTV